MTEKPDVERLIALYKLVLDFRSVERIVYIPGPDEVPENDVDHTYALTLIAWYLAPHFPELNAEKVLHLALAHDLVEVHSGDTSVFDADHVATKQTREDEGRARLKREWPDFPALHQNLQEYADRKTPEAKFVYALDKIMPIIINYLGDGHGWRKRKITFQQLHEVKKDKVRHHSAVADYYQQLYDLLLERPEFFHQAKPPSQQR